LASRDSFQKRQKEAARREKRQSKLDRRQGRQPSHADRDTENSDNDALNVAETEGADVLSAEAVLAALRRANVADPALERDATLFKPVSTEPEQLKSDNPRREP